LLFASCIGLDSLFFNPTPLTSYTLAYPAGWPSERQVPPELIEKLELTSPGQTSIFAVWARRPDAESSTAPTVLYHHGNAGNIDVYWSRAAHLWSLGANVLIYDYPGYGMSPGSSSEPEVYRAARRALSYLRSLGDAIDQGRLINYGYSLGGAPAIELGAHDGPFGGLITESTFTSVAGLSATGSLVVPASFVMTNRFDNLAKIREAASNSAHGVLMFHGRADDFVAFHMGERLAAQIGPSQPAGVTLGPGMVHFEPVDGAHHGDLPAVADRHNAQYSNTVAGYLAQAQ
jgi:fermentation-respiration switch protein FrsA (DUF1100 family)